VRTAIGRAAIGLVAALALAACGGGGGGDDGPSSDRLTLRPLGTVQGALAGYAEYLPPGYGDGEKRPLLVFLHGSGSNGDGSEESLQALFDGAIPSLIADDRWPNDRPFVVLMPQHRQADGFCPSSDEVEAFLEFAIAHYDVDPKRVYLTGLSCGAYGGWAYLGENYDGLLAAAVLISGDGREALREAGCFLGRTAIWAFHGAADPTVDPAGSVEPMRRLKRCTHPRPVDARLTVYPGVGHDAWERTYDLSAGHDVYSWLLSHEHA